MLGNIKTNLAYASTVLLASSALVSAQCTIPRSGLRWKDNGGPLAQPANGWASLKDFTCGGQDWTGAKCCSQGTCKVSNQWYSQCV
ncbi:hypothetical protein OOU_Y34scaffold00300g2 [Pyricularia oryzae Y34]|uniref:CBM1 domain-containing protein n=1 Tax=Pyricularia oryzae (strain Y34) TaxID=1143189 RepID=A0AA97P380_PYRO3|nr:hypothetical protein OOU_Y34scaffold00300g2 [Pyricularia oryzae Y34]